MDNYERLKKNFLLVGLDEEFNLRSIFTDVAGIFYYYNTVKIVEFSMSELDDKILIFLKKLLEDNLFEISGNIEGIELKNLSVEDVLLKIKFVMENDRDSDIFSSIYFNLTERGKEEAKKYLLQMINVKEKILINGSKSCQNLKDIFDITKQEFKTNDLEDIQYESINAVCFLLQNKFIEVGELKGNYNFTAWSYTAYDYYKHLKSELSNIGKESKNIEISWFKNIHPTDILIDKWKECGGRLVNKWYDLIDNR